MKEVYRAENIQDAHMMKAVLEQQGIHVTIFGESLAGALGELPVFAIGPILNVPDEQYDKAFAIIQKAQAQNQKISSLPSWDCGSCSESNEGQFSRCWSCGVEHNS